MWEQEKGKGDESKMGAKVNYLELLKQWGDVLLRLQIRQMDDLKLDGGILCPACKHIHGRCPDAIYGLMTLADRTGEKKYLDGARALFRHSARQCYGKRLPPRGHRIQCGGKRSASDPLCTCSKG